ncbi:MAG: lipase maturation factor family protein [Bdellovibrionota bacterium]
MVAPTHAKRATLLGVWYFLRLLGLVYLIAFGSLWAQVHGLIGEQGIAPARQLFEILRQHYGNKAFASHPSLLWLSPSDLALDVVCGLGCFLSAALVFGKLQRLCAFLLWLLYLSLVNADYVFLQFQWDTLLLEAGFLAIFLAPNEVDSRIEHMSLPHGDAVFLVRLLLFRLMFCSGVVKLTSGDPAWRNLHALEYHFFTQPLPNRPAYYVSKLPLEALMTLTGLTFFVELIVPLFYFGPRRLRHLAAVLTAGFQLIILATGNFAFFNILTIALCFVLFDDESLSRLSPKPIRNRYFVRGGAPSQTVSFPIPSGLLLAFLLFAGSVELLSTLAPDAQLPKPMAQTAQIAQPFHLVNRYGLFAVMTSSRHEIVVEGSNDRENWLPYVNRWKPGDANRPPRQVAPYQPRLDWQLWFAALSSPDQNVWFLQLLYRLHEGSEPVLSLFESNPFPEAPPKYLRAVIYDYRFTHLSEHEISGAWWERKLLGLYVPAVSFDEPKAP